MNNITKEKVAFAVLSAMSDEDLRNKEAAAHFGFSASYMSWLKNEMYYDRIPDAAWNVMREWKYSGKKIKDFFPGEYTSEQKPAQQEPAKEPEKPIIRVKPGVKEARKKELVKRKTRKNKVKQPEANIIRQDDPSYFDNIAKAADEQQSAPQEQVQPTFFNTVDSPHVAIPAEDKEVFLEPEQHPIPGQESEYEKLKEDAIYEIMKSRDEFWKYMDDCVHNAVTTFLSKEKEKEVMTTGGIIPMIVGSGKEPLKIILDLEINVKLK